MIFSKPAILAAFALLPTLTTAIDLPRLDAAKNDDNNKNNLHHFDLDFNFNTEGDFEYTPEILSIIEQAMIMSANESHPSDKFHIYSFSINKASHGPAKLLRGQDEDENLEWRFCSIFRKCHRQFWHQASGGGNTGCVLCGGGDDDDTMMMLPPSELMDGRSALEAVVEDMDGLGRGRMKVWEDMFCDLLSQNESMSGAKECKISISIQKD